MLSQMKFKELTLSLLSAPSSFMPIWTYKNKWSQPHNTFYKYFLRYKTKKETY
jgi:hypothetical protein